MLEEKVEPQRCVILDFKTYHKVTAIRTAPNLHQDKQIGL